MRSQIQIAGLRRCANRLTVRFVLFSFVLVSAGLFFSCKSGEGDESEKSRGTGENGENDLSPGTDNQRIPLNVPSDYSWDAAVSVINSADGGNAYLINLTGDITVPGLAAGSATFASPDADVWIKGNHTIKLGAPGRLLNIRGEDQTVTIEDATLVGLSLAAGDAEDNTNSQLIRITDGAMALRGASVVTGNTGYAGIGLYGSGSLDMRDTVRVSGNTGTSRGGGIFVGDYATVTMGGNAEVSGNISNSYGGGVCCYSGNATLIMEENAKVSGNRSNGIGGGGVGTEHGLIILKDNATIVGNTAMGNNSGGGVTAWSGGRLYMAGGTINGYNSGHSPDLHNPQNNRDTCNIVWHNSNHLGGKGAAINVADSQAKYGTFSAERQTETDIETPAGFFTVAGNLASPADSNVVVVNGVPQ